MWSSSLTLNFLLCWKGPMVLIRSLEKFNLTHFIGETFVAHLIEDFGHWGCVSIQVLKMLASKDAHLYSRTVRVELLFYSSSSSFSLASIILSNILENVGRSLIGRLFSSFEWTLPVFGFVIMTAYYHFAGKWLLWRQALNIFSSLALLFWGISLAALLLIPSWPGAVQICSCLIISVTSTSLIGSLVVYPGLRCYDL